MQVCYDSATRDSCADSAAPSRLLHFLPTAPQPILNVLQERSVSLKTREVESSPPRAMVPTGRVDKALSSLSRQAQSTLWSN